MISKQEEIFNKLKNESLEEMNELNKEVNPDNLIYRNKGPTTDVKFDELDNALNLLNKTKEGEASLTKAKNDRKRFKSDLGERKKKKQKE